MSRKPPNCDRKVLCAVRQRSVFASSLVRPVTTGIWWVYVVPSSQAMYSDKYGDESKTSTLKPTNVVTTSSESITEEEKCRIGGRLNVMPNRKHG